LDVADAGGKSLFQQPPRAGRGQDYLGGKTLHSFTTLRIPPDFAPGAYTIRVTLEDKAAKASKTLEKKVEVLPAAFGVVQVGTSADPDGHIPVAPVGALGSSLYVNFA